MPAEYGNDNDNGNSYEDIDSTDFKELSKFFFYSGGREARAEVRGKPIPQILSHILMVKYKRPQKLIPYKSWCGKCFPENKLFT